MSKRKPQTVIPPLPPVTTGIPMGISACRLPAIGTLAYGNSTSDNFDIERELSLFPCRSGISFAHKRFPDKPENHFLHINNHCEIYIFVDGDADYIVEKHYYKLRRGDILLINPHEVHKVVLKNDAVYERFYILVKEGALDAFADNPMTRLLTKPVGVSNLISLPPDEREEILSVLYRISGMATGGTPSYRLFGQVLEFLYLLNCGYSKGSAFHQNTGCDSFGEASGSSDKLVSEALSYVDANLTTLQSVSEIASKMNVSLPYLSAHFSRLVGTSLSAYIQAKRIAYAKGLLDAGTDDVTRVCYESGFNECSYFIRIFKKYIGMTPLQYRKRGR